MKLKSDSLCSCCTQCFGSYLFLTFLAVAVILWPHGAAGQITAVSKLTHAQVEQLVSSKVPDSTMSTQIQRRGLAFAPTPAIIESLRGKGAGPMTLATIEALSPKGARGAVARAEEAKHIPAEDIAGLIARGNREFDSQHWNDAVRAYESVLMYSPKNLNVRADLGIADFYLGNSDRAIAELRRVLSYDPHFNNALFNLGIILSQTNDRNGAIDALSQVASQSNYENHEKATALLERLRSQTR